ncbi:MAG: hypothetical protein D3909_12810 [Candidatus Electrothrix sp. ATG1]|nr:hypothetical protein [Candidatus Electrothrix sp. ATG1]
MQVILYESTGDSLESPDQLSCPVVPSRKGRDGSYTDLKIAHFTRFSFFNKGKIPAKAFFVNRGG